MTQVSFAVIDLLGKRAGPDLPDFDPLEREATFFVYTTGPLADGGYAAFVVPPGWTGRGAGDKWKVFETADLAKQQRDDWLASRLASDGLVALPGEGPTLETRVVRCPGGQHAAVAADADGRCIQCWLPEDLQAEAGAAEAMVDFLQDHDRTSATHLARQLFS